MLNHQQRNEQLIKDILFLERVFLLEIEEVDRSSVEQKVEALSTKSDLERRQKAGGRRQKEQLQGDSNPPAIEDRQIKDYDGGFRPTSEKEEGKIKPSALCPQTSAFQGGSLGRSILLLGLLFIYAVLITLLSPLPDSLEEANDEVVVKAQKIEQLRLLETELNQARLKRQSLESQIAQYREQQSLSLPQTREALSTSNDEISATSEVKETGQAADLVLEQLPPLPVPELPLSTSNAEIIAASEIEEILQVADLVLESLPPLPVPEVPLSNSNAEIPIRQVVEDIEDESFEPEPQLQIAPESEVETPEVTVTEEIELMGGWLGEANVVYHSSISDPSEAEEQLNSSVSDNIQQTEHSLFADEDLRKYLTSTPLSSEPKSNPASVSVESEPRAGVNDQIEAELAEVTVTEALETESTSPTEERPLFADKNLRQYLTSTPLSFEPKSSSASVSVESKLRAGVNDQIEAELAEVTVNQALETEPASIPEERPLFADEDLKKYLTSTPLYSDDVLKQRLNRQP